MDDISIYSSTLINKIMEAKEISYYELKRYFEQNKIYPNSKQINNFNLDNELDQLEKLGIIEDDEGMIIFQGI